MSYERRLEIEALPAEAGWGKWQAVIGAGTTLVERKSLGALAKIWVVWPSGPHETEATSYEYWQFAQDGKPVHKRFFSYTIWHTDTTYTNYSPRAKQLRNLCADTREELCRLVQELLEAELGPLRKTVAEKESILKNFAT